MGKYEQSVRALIDTGAPRTLFPRGVAEALGIELPDHASVELKKVHLMGREWRASSRWVSLSLPPFTDLGWDAEVDFVLDEGLPFGLLGYEGFLNRWAVSFNGYNGYFVVEPVESFQERLPIDPYEEFLKEWPDIY